MSGSLADNEGFEMEGVMAPSVFDNCWFRTMVGLCNNVGDPIPKISPIAVFEIGENPFFSTILELAPTAERNMCLMYAEDLHEGLTTNIPQDVQSMAMKTFIAYLTSAITNTPKEMRRTLVVVISISDGSTIWQGTSK